MAQCSADKSPPPMMADVLAIRRATTSDAEAIRALTRAAYAKWVHVIGREPKPMTADYTLEVLNHRIDLLHRDGEFVALIELVDQKDHLIIENVAVAPAHQGRGLGRMLMAHAAAVAIGAGYSAVRLYTNKRFSENIRLYEALGYEVDREEELAHGIAVHMSKRLDGGSHPPRSPQ